MGSAREWKLVGIGFLVAVVLLIGIPSFIVLMGQPASHEAGPNASNWQAYTALMQNVPHIMSELTQEFILGIIVYPIAKIVWDRGKRIAIQQHDKEYNHEHDG